MNITLILLELLGKSAVVLAFAVLVCAVMRHASAARKHLVWAAAFVALLLLPLTKLATPRWHLPLHRPAAHVAVPLEAPVNFMEDAQALPDTAIPDQRTHLPDWGRVVFGIWLAGCVALVGYRLLGCVQLARLKRRSIPVADPSIMALARRVAAECAPGRDVEIRVTPEMRVPVTWGVWKPVLVLPVDIASWGEERLTAALRHEFGHIARRDFLVRVAAQFATALYWPNPLAWFASRSLQMAQEQACDDLVLRAGTPADEYASLLFDATRKWNADGLATRHAIAMAKACTLEKRVSAIVDHSRDRRPAALKTKLSVSLALASVLVAGAIAQIAPAQDTATFLPDDWPPAKEGLVTVEYDVPSKFITPVDGGYRGPDGKTYATARELLEANGIEFPPGCSANYLKMKGKLNVRTTIDSQNTIGKFYNLPAIPHPVAKIKLPDAILPKVSFKDATVRECVAYFQKLSVELDTKQTDPKLKGVNIVMKMTPGDDIVDKKITLELANVSYREAFKKFADAAGLDAFSDDWAILLVPSNEREPYNPQYGFKSLELHVDGSMDLNGVPVADLRELAKKTQEIHEKNPDMGIVIEAGSGTPIKQIADVSDALKKAGVKKIAVETLPTDPAKPADQNPPSPMDITSDSTSFENEVATAKGNAVLRYGGLIIQADLIKIDSKKHAIEARGHVSFLRQDAGSKTTTKGEKVSYNLDTQKLDSDGQVVVTPQ